MSLHVKKFYDNIFFYENALGQIHREDGPAVIWGQPEDQYYLGNEYYINGLRHREDGPAVDLVDYKCYYINGKKHREDGPAEITKTDSFWYKNDLRHREDGPACVGINGYESWFKNGLRHREDGPALIDGDREEYWIDDVKITKEEFEKRNGKNE